ncbi:MAG: hypothetical protein WA628_22770 [Terriglobales bacterium]
MKLTVILLVCVVRVGCTRPKPFSKCMADADQIISEVQEHRIVYGPSGQFGTPLGQRSTSELFDRDEEMISCIASDPENRPHYREALDMDDTVKSDRFLQYLLDTKQMQNFGRWEEQRQTAAKNEPQ